MKIAINENSLFNCNFVEFIHAVGKAGFKCVEISYPKILEIVRYVSISELRSLVKSYGIEIITMNAFENALAFPLGSENIIASETMLLANLCNAIECPAVIIVAHKWIDDVTPKPAPEEIYSLTTQRLVLIKDILKEHNIESYFEPISYPEFTVASPDVVNNILSDNRLKEIKLAQDIHNLYPLEKSANVLNKYNNKIGVVHLNDTMNVPEKEQHVTNTRTFPGEGIANVSDWIKKVKEIGFNGYYSLEIFSKEIYMMRPDEAAVLCKKKMDKFCIDCNDSI